MMLLERVIDILHNSDGFLLTGYRTGLHRPMFLSRIAELQDSGKPHVGNRGRSAVLPSFHPAFPLSSVGFTHPRV